MKRFTTPFAVIITAFAFITTVVQGQIFFDGSPGIGAPPATLGPYTMTPFPADGRPSSAFCLFPFVTGLPAPLGLGTITTSPSPIEHWTGNGLLSGHGYLGDFYSLTCGTSNSTFTLTFPSGVGAFYFYAISDQLGTFSITATCGATSSGAIPVTTPNGAQYFGFYAAPGGTLTSVTITTTALDLIFGEFGIAACTGPTITQNPLDQTICESSTAFFFANATGFSTVQWQVSTDAGATWNNIVGATSLLYAIGAVPASYNGRQYRAVFTASGGCTSTTTAATLTVWTAPTVTLHPVPIVQTLCEGATLSYTSAATSSPAPTVQWQVSTNGGATFTDIGGATSATYSTTVTPGMAGNIYRAVWTNPCGVANSNTALLQTVNTLPVVTTNPTNQAVCAPNTATFTSAATGSPVPTVQWQLSTDGGTTWNPIGGATSPSYTTPTTTAAMNGYQYRAIWTNACGPVNSAAAILTVNTAATMALQPTNQTVCIATPATFTAASAGSPTPSAQWYLSTDAGATWNPIAGANSSSYTTPPTTLAMNGWRYYVTFVNLCGGVGSTVAILSTNASATTTDPSNQTVCAPNTATFSVTIGGAPTPSVQWQLSTDGGTTWNNIGGATSTSYTTPATTTSMSGYQYRAVVSNSCATATSLAAILTVNQAPIVTTHPSNQTVCDGGVATFTSAATGTPTPTVQWQYSTNSGSSWINVAGATSPTYSPPVFAVNNGWWFRAVWTNSCGSTNSNPAILTVNTPPSITLHPVNLTVCAPTPASFTAAASGQPTPTVQWQLSTDGGSTWNNIGGATSTTYTTGATSTAMSGYQYRAVFTNSCGTATTTAATLTVNEAPTVTLHPANQTVCDGGIATFTSAATGTPTPTVQWQYSTNSGSSWINVAGGTSPTYSAPMFAGNNGWWFRAVWTNSCGTTNSNPAVLTVNTPPTVTLHPQSGTWCPGSIATFTAAATGTAPISVQWQLSADGGVTWTNIAGATSTTLNFGPIGAGHAGNLIRAVFTNVCAPGPVPPGGVASNNATINLGFPPTVTQHPASQTVCVGASVTFTAAATGTAPITQQWFKSVDNGVTWSLIAGATGTSYTIASVTTGDAGQYRCTFYNGCAPAGVNTNAATLTVNTPPTITQNPTGQSNICVNSSVTLQSAATGTPTPTVQWQTSSSSGGPWSNISGATSPNYTFTFLNTHHLQWFRALYTNVCGTAATNAVQLTKELTPPTVTCPANITVSNAINQCGANVSFAASATDNCPGPITLSYSPPSGSFFPVGVTTVTCTATDQALNTSTCTFTVRVNDTQFPTISGIAPIVASTDPNVCYRLLANTNLGAVTASDNCPGVTLSNNAPVQFPKGTTIVTWTATDASGNVTTATQSVTINDTQPPTITAPAALTLPTDLGVCSRWLGNTNLGVPTVADNCPGVTYAHNAPATFPLGTTTVTWTATDASGNTATATQTVTIVDTERPYITFNPTPAMLIPANQTMRGIAANVYHFDNCPNYTWRLLSIISSEADAGLFPGDLPNDIQASIGTPTQSFSLRAERAGLSRMYWITYSITDAVNLSYQTTRAVVVPFVRKDETPAATPSQFALEQNYPNPFNPSTMIRYAVPEDATVTLKVFNILGEEVAELANGEVKAGYHEALFDATGLASGSYVYRLTATTQSGEKHTASKTLVVAK